MIYNCRFCLQRQDYISYLPEQNIYLQWSLLPFPKHPPSVIENLFAFHYTYARIQGQIDRIQAGQGVAGHCAHGYFSFTVEGFSSDLHICFVRVRYIILPLRAESTILGRSVNCIENWRPLLTPTLTLLEKIQEGSRPIFSCDKQLKK